MRNLSLVWNADARAGDELQLLLSVIDALTLEPDLKSFFARAAQVVRELVAADGAALILMTPERQLEYQFFHGAPVEHLNGFAGHRFDPASGVTGAALREGRPLFIADYAAYDDAIPAFVEAGLQSSLILPLQGSRGPVGALAMSWFRAGAEAPDASRLALAERVASQVAVACERHALELELARTASRDALTGLANRARLFELLDARLGAEPARGFAVVLIDLDGFKAINDERGHEFGDRVLKDIAVRIRETCRRSDDVGRLGGDEFVVLTALPHRRRDVDGLVRRINHVLSIQMPTGHSRHRLSASVGVATYPEDGTDAETLLRRADLAMYQAKREGGNGYRLFDRHMEEDVRARQQLLDEIGPALQNGEFLLHYQPVVAVGENRPVALEALLRWKHPRTGLRSAGEFIGTVERYGRALVRSLGCWVLETAARDLQRWQRQGRGLAVHVNVSACYFLNPCFIRDLEQILARGRGFDPRGLVLELTETALMDDLDRAAEVMAACRGAGVRLALDDFGTGYASLTYLRRLPVDTVKIDRSFVRDLCEQTNDRGIVRGILAMARALNLSVVAEGVETAAHADALLRLGCEHMQGYGLGRPMPRADLDAWLQGPTGKHVERPLPERR